MSSTIPNQFCLDIILCRIRGAFDHLMYPYSCIPMSNTFPVSSSNPSDLNAPQPIVSAFKS